MNREDDTLGMMPHDGERLMVFDLELAFAEDPEHSLCTLLDLLMDRNACLRRAAFLRELANLALAEDRAAKPHTVRQVWHRRVFSPTCVKFLNRVFRLGKLGPQVAPLTNGIAAKPQSLSEYQNLLKLIANRELLDVWSEGRLSDEDVHRLHRLTCDPGTLLAAHQQLWALCYDTERCVETARNGAVRPGRLRMTIGKAIEFMSVLRAALHPRTRLALGFAVVLAFAVTAAFYFQSAEEAPSVNREIALNLNAANQSDAKHGAEFGTLAEKTPLPKQEPGESDPRKSQNTKPDTPVSAQQNPPGKKDLDPGEIAVLGGPKKGQGLKDSIQPVTLKLSRTLGTTLGINGVAWVGDAENQEPAGVKVDSLVSTKRAANLVHTGNPKIRGYLEKGDIITKVDGIEIKTVADLVNALQYAGSGSELRLTVWDKNTKMEVDWLVVE